MPKKLYRNINDIQLPDGEIIDHGSLFILVDEKLVLVDDDRYIAFAFPDDNFILV